MRLGPASSPTPCPWANGLLCPKSRFYHNGIVPEILPEGFSGHSLCIMSQNPCFTTMGSTFVSKITFLPQWQRSWDFARGVFGPFPVHYVTESLFYHNGKPAMTSNILLTFMATIGAWLRLCALLRREQQQKHNQAVSKKSRFFCRKQASQTWALVIYIFWESADENAIQWYSMQLKPSSGFFLWLWLGLSFQNFGIYNWLLTVFFGP